MPFHANSWTTHDTRDSGPYSTSTRYEYDGMMGTGTAYSTLFVLDDG